MQYFMHVLRFESWKTGKREIDADEFMAVIWKVTMIEGTT
jgi:hypothetical protein